MVILGYVGNHNKDTLAVRLGWRLTRLVQRGEFKRVTHTECVLEGENYKRCTIASSSVRDGGVRIKEDIALTKDHWIALEVPSFKVVESWYWFQSYRGCGYDWVGAVATKLSFLRWFPHSPYLFFCNEACLAAFRHDADELTPSECFEMLTRDCGAVDVTDKFFEN